MSFLRLALPLTNCHLDESQKSSHNSESQNIKQLTGNLRQKEEMKIGAETGKKTADLLQYPYHAQMDEHKQAKKKARNHSK
jgi:hypothetical protein